MPKQYIVILLMAHWMLTSCTPAEENTDHAQEATHSTVSATDTNFQGELTAEQQSSFDALNTLQVNTDEKNRLYSTFADVAQPCYPPDTSFVISRPELQAALEQFVAQHCTGITIEKRKELVSAAVLAQEEYTVLHCRGNSPDITYANGLPMSGTWIIPGVLGRRDVVLIW